MKFNVIVLTSCFLLIGLFSSVTTAHQIKLPDLGDTAAQALPIYQEKWLGEKVTTSIRGHPTTIFDPVLNEYLSDIGVKLTRHSDDVRFPFKYFLLNNNSINASASFGGNIIVHTGLITASDNESQFASVLAHEIAHVTQRHLARRFQHQQQNNPFSIATLLTGVLTMLLSPDLGMAIINAGASSQFLEQQSYSRNAEHEADRIGIEILQRAGFDPRQSSEFFKKLLPKHVTDDFGAFLRTHPLTKSRISDMRSRADQYPVKSHHSSLGYQLAKSRILARYTYDSAQAEIFFRNKLQTNFTVDKYAQYYGLALTLLDQKQLEAAEKIIKNLLKQQPNNLFYLDTYTDLLIAQRQPERAMQMLDKHYQLRPNNPVLTLNYAYAAVKAKKSDAAISRLKRFLLRRPESIVANELLIEAYQLAGDHSRRYEVEAEKAKLQGRYQDALKHITQAKAHTGIEQTLTHSRLRAKQQTYKELLEEQSKL